jgi:predicted RNA-binding protein with PUA-like domain
MRAAKGLEEMVLLQRGNRLSITPVTSGQLKAVLKLLDAKF